MKLVRAFLVGLAILVPVAALAGVGEPDSSCCDMPCCETGCDACPFR